MSLLTLTALRKWTKFLILAVFVYGPFSQVALSQEVIHSFKITGEQRIPFISGASKERTVEYDPSNSDHLIISNLGSNGVLLEKAQFLFNGNKFNLSNFQEYLNTKKLFLDGIYTTYAEDQGIDNEVIYTKGIIQQQTIFYTNGKKQMTFNGDENLLNGEFIIWHPNGQISFKGNYKNNQKDGLFESFDTSGKLERKGVYRDGKVIEGESVVQDFIYDTPEVPASFKDNDSIFNELLRLKSADLDVIRKLEKGIKWNVDVTFTIDKSGKINAVEIKDKVDTLNGVVVKSVFNHDFEGFKPALMEGAPVRSYLTKVFSISNKGLQLFTPYSDFKNDTVSQSALSKVEEMPEFPGGEKGLLQFLAKTVRYPRQATEKNIQGKVFVTFIIMEDGKIANVTIAKGAHPLLDAEAVRVAQLMPKWIPGKQDGKVVRVSYTVPINFVLE